MRHFLKTEVYRFLYALNFLKGLFFSRKEVSVLMYHSVEDGSWKLGVGAKEFQRHMEYLSAHYHIVPVSDVVAFIQGEKDLAHKTVALTFDDGYADAYTTVFPIIKKLQIPITVFLTTNLEKTWGKLKRLTWDHIKEMYESELVDFQAHGHNHINLVAALASSTEAKEELEVCCGRIQEHLGCIPRYLAYAAGYKNDAVMAFVKSAGFDAAFSITEGLIKKGDDPFAIKRIQVDRTMNFFLFKARLTGAVGMNRKCIDFIRSYYEKTR